MDNKKSSTSGMEKVKDETVSNSSAGGETGSKRASSSQSADASATRTSSRQNVDAGSTRVSSRQSADAGSTRVSSRQSGDSARASSRQSGDTNTTRASSRQSGDCTRASSRQSGDTGSAQANSRQSGNVSSTRARSRQSGDSGSMRANSRSSGHYGEVGTMQSGGEGGETGSILGSNPSVSNVHPGSINSVHTAGALSNGGVSGVGSNISIPNTAGSIGSYQSIPGTVSQADSNRSIGPVSSSSTRPTSSKGGFFKSRFRVNSTRSVSGSSGSFLKVNIVTEALSVDPSLTSAFSLDGITASNDFIHGSSYTPPPNMGRNTSDFEQGMSSSYKESLDMLDNPAYIDTVKSMDSELRRSLSVPSQYTYKTDSPSQRRPMAREVFEDFIPKEEKVNVVKENLEMGTAKFGAKKMERSMSDLYENPDYLDSLQSTSSGAALLARTAITITKDGKKVYHRTLSTANEEEDEVIQPGKYVKNLIVLSVSFMFIFTAYMSLRNLQSSINSDDGLAVYALSTVYASLFLGCIFATTIVQRLRPKNTMMLCMIGFLVYVGANFYAHFYTLVPASALVGFCLGIMWTAHATYLTSIAANYAGITSKNLHNIVSKFNGIFFMFFGMSQVIGGIVSSTVLMAEPVHADDSNKLLLPLGVDNHSHQFQVIAVNLTAPVVKNFKHCGYSFCLSASSSKDIDVSDNLIYLLLGIFAGFTVLGISLTVIFLDPLEGVMKKSHASLADQMSAVFRWFWDWKVVCLLGLMFYTLVEMSFMFGEFTKVGLPFSVSHS